MHEKAHRYVLLDAIRGIAAISIFHLHFISLFGGHILGSSRLAVDLFFTMSGFVIAASYDEKFKSGMTVTTFMAYRLIRFYPLYFLGLLISLASVMVTAIYAGEGPVSPQEVHALTVSALYSLFMLPTLGLPDICVLHRIYLNYLFPLNSPAWSLFFELGINLIYAICFRWLGNRALTYTILIALAWLAVNVIVTGDIGTGPTWFGLVSGLPRVVFSFFTGVLVFRNRAYLARLSLSLGRSSGLAMAAILLAVLAMMLCDPPPGVNPGAYTLVLVTILFPTTVCLATNHQPHRPAAIALCTFLGNVSYAIYVLHMPVIVLIGEVRKIAFGITKQPIPLSWELLVLVVFCGLCYMLDGYFDQPARTLLRNKLLRKAPVAVPGQA